MSGVNEMKKDEAPDCHEMRADTSQMVNVVGEIDASWTKRLLNICMNSCEVVEE